MVSHVALELLRSDGTSVKRMAQLPTRRKEFYRDPQRSTTTELTRRGLTPAGAQELAMSRQLEAGAARRGPRDGCGLEGERRVGAQVQWALEDAHEWRRGKCTRGCQRLLTQGQDRGQLAAQQGDVRNGGS